MSSKEAGFCVCCLALVVTYIPSVLRDGVNRRAAPPLHSKSLVGSGCNDHEMQLNVSVCSSGRLANVGVCVPRLQHLTPSTGDDRGRINKVGEELGK